MVRNIKSEGIFNYTQITLESGKALTVTNEHGVIILDEKLNKKIVKANDLKEGSSWVLYQEIADRGYTKSVTHSHRDPLGVVHVEIRLRWTQKGRLFIYELMKKAGNLPVCEREQEDKSNV